jgi:hypothetical protein
MRIRILVVEDNPFWAEQLAMMYCRVLRQARETLRTSNAPPSYCRRCTYAESCIEVSPGTDATRAPRDEFVSVAKNFNEAKLALKLTRNQIDIKTRKFDIISLDMNLGGVGGNGEDVLDLACLGNGRVSVIAITGFRNDKVFEQSNPEKYNRMWNLRQKLSSTANGSCEVFEKSYRLIDALAVITRSAEELKDSDQLKTRVFEVVACLQERAHTNMTFGRLEESGVKEQVIRIENALTPAYLNDLVRLTDNSKPLDKDDLLCLHYEVPDDLYLSNGYKKSYALIMVKDTGELYHSFSFYQFNTLGNTNKMFDNNNNNNNNNFMFQLVTRLGVLLSNPLVTMSCSKSSSNAVEPRNQTYPIRYSEEKQMKLLLTRLGVDRLLHEMKSSQPGGLKTTKQELTDLEKTAHFPFDTALGVDLTPRTHNDWKGTGNEGRTTDPKYKVYLNQYLRTLFETNDDVIYTNAKHIKLRPKVRIYIHRKESYSISQREVQLMDWNSVKDQKSEMAE